MSPSFRRTAVRRFGGRIAPPPSARQVWALRNGLRSTDGFGHSTRRRTRLVLRRPTDYDEPIPQGFPATRSHAHRRGNSAYPVTRRPDTSVEGLKKAVDGSRCRRLSWRRGGIRKDE